MQKWTDCLSVSKLPARWAWVSYYHQLWAKLRYGLGTNSSPVEDLDKAEETGCFLRSTYRKMLPFLGVNRNIKGEVRHFLSPFEGIGLRRLLPGVVIARINLFLQHYGTPSTLGIELNMVLQNLQLKIGTNKCPLHLPYEPWGKSITPSWIRSF